MKNEINNLSKYTISTAFKIFSFICAIACFLIAGLFFICSVVAKLAFFPCLALLCGGMLWTPKIYNKFIYKFKAANGFWYSFVASIVSIGLFFIGMFLVTMVFSSDTNSNYKNKEITKSYAENNGYSDAEKVAVTQVKCHNALKSRTINPKIIDRRDYSIMDKSVVVYGTIESQNAYSGTIRQNWSCECIIDEEADTIKLNDLIIE